DEARTPLIISGASDKSTEMYSRADQFVTRLKSEADYTADEKKRTINLTEEGVEKAENYFGIENLSDIENTELAHHINQALKARYQMRRDKDYVVQNGQVIIVDEFTGRLMLGRRYNEGLHQAIEAKEGVQVERESKTLATITFQNYFRMYRKLAGMTGTAKTEEEEFLGIYSLDVVEVPTHKEMIRVDENDAVYKTENGKFGAVIEEIIQRHSTGQPVLVGTVSVEKSERLSDMLKKRGVPHQVLNAKHHEREAQIVAQAGKLQAVTIATNMAGRGTDILLGGNPEFMARQEMQRRGYEEDMIELANSHTETKEPEVLAAREKYRKLHAEFKKETDAEHDQVVAVGGLHIIGTERHESRRIDNQLRGRSGRQGDPGSSRFFIAMEDDIMRLFGAERLLGMVDSLGMDEEMSLQYGMLSKQIEAAQKRVESRNFDIRKAVLQYDDVMNQQREIIYSQRRQVLMDEDMKGSVVKMMHTLLESAADIYLNGTPDLWDVSGLSGYVKTVFGREPQLPSDELELERLGKNEITRRILDFADRCYEDKEKELTEKSVDMREVERIILLRMVDSKWMDHIDAMDQMKQGIGLQAYGQRDPVVEYKFRGFEMFEEMVASIQEDTVRGIMHLTVGAPLERRQVATPTRASHGGQEGGQARRKPVKVDKKVGRNDPCTCGSGKKYKNCCGKSA
ncbi:MAG: preprotein translocase subunit SecA, partial [Christensenellales bacterium]